MSTQLLVLFKAQALSMIPSTNRNLCAKSIGCLCHSCSAATIFSIQTKRFVRSSAYVFGSSLYELTSVVSYAAVMGIIEDTHMPSNGFSHLAIAFYVSFLVCEPLQSLFIQKFPTAKYLGANVVLWGIIVTLNCVCKNYASLVALRVLLGCFESSVAPSLVTITGMWYKKREQVVRMGIWYEQAYSCNLWTC